MKDPIAKLLGGWSEELNVYSIILRVFLAVILSAVIGCERASKRHSAGLKTFILVALGTTMSMIIDIYFINDKSGVSFLLSSATVVGLAIITVKSLLISSRSQIKGLTTAVALWTDGILGLVTGAGLYTVSVIGFIVIICCLSFFPAVEKYLKNRSDFFEIHLELKNSSYLQNFASTIRKLGLKIDDIEANNAYKGSGLSVYSISLFVDSPELKKYKTHKEIIEALESLDYIYHIEEMVS